MRNEELYNVIKVVTSGIGLTEHVAHVGEMNS